MCLGPLFWNVMYDGLLRLALPEGVCTVAFADDCALVLVARSVREIEYLGDRAIELVSSWLSDRGLTVSDTALSAITGCPPVDLLAHERECRYREGRRGTENSPVETRARWSRATIDEWQRR